MVIAIIGLLIALLLPAVQSSRESSRRNSCTNQLKQIGLAVHGFHDVYRRLPPSRWDEGITWAVMILPFMEQQTAFRLWNPQPPNSARYYAANNKAARESVVAGYFCPSRRSPSGQEALTDPVNGGLGDCVQLNCSTAPGRTPGALGDYAACIGTTSLDYAWPNATVGSNGAFVYGTVNGWVRVAQITDGLSKTLFVGEKHIPQGGFRTDPDTSIFNGDNSSAFRAAGVGFALAQGPTDAAAGNNRFGSWHPGICLFVMGDGSVRGLRNSINTTILGNLASRNDGQATPSDD